MMSDRSFIEKLNNRGSRIDPCGTPRVTFNDEDMDVPIRVVCSQLVR